MQTPSEWDALTDADLTAVRDRYEALVAETEPGKLRRHYGTVAMRAGLELHRRARIADAQKATVVEYEFVGPHGHALVVQQGTSDWSLLWRARLEREWRDCIRGFDTQERVDLVAMCWVQSGKEPSRQPTLRDLRPVPTPFPQAMREIAVEELRAVESGRRWE